MNKVLIDSSIWIHYFRNGTGEVFDQVDRLLDEDQVVLCGMVELEIIQGVRPKERSMIKSLFAALPFENSERLDFQYAGELLNQLRKKGTTIPSSDCLIASLCLRRGLSLFHHDKHFKTIPNLRHFL